MLVKSAHEEQTAKKSQTGKGNHYGGRMRGNIRNASHYYLFVVSGNAVHAALDENQAELGVL